MTSNPSRRLFRDDNSDDENDEVSARMAKQGIIPTIPSLSIALPQSNFDRFINKRSPNNTKKIVIGVVVVAVIVTAFIGYKKGWFGKKAG
jgi:hypothetical protein